MKDLASFQVYNASAGSGKTFTLVKSYLKIILSTPNTYRFKQILAITFTNKAAQEMKARVLSNLKAISDGAFNDLALQLCEETSISKNQLQQRASLVLNEILNNYSAFSITTIDSFTYKLIKNFAFDLGLSLNFEVELNTKNVLTNAVDLLISKIGKDQNITNVLLLFALFKWQQDETWDVTFALNNIANLLADEDAILEVETLNNKTLTDFSTLHKILHKRIQTFEKEAATLGEKGLDIITVNGISSNAFLQSDFPNFLKKLINSDFETINFEGRLAKNIAGSKWYKNDTALADKAAIDAHSNHLLNIFTEVENLFSKQYANYVLAKLIITKLIPLSVLSELNKCVETYKIDHNIRLNSEFNQLIRNHLKNEPASFIYEKIGEKYSHFFIDEMQDTSVFQWENLIPLIGNALHQGDSSLFLVGDAKQAIYRWRGGKAQQFISLSKTKGDEAPLVENPFFIDKEVKALDTNFRSYSEIVKFNNGFFKNSAKYLSDESHKNLYEFGTNQNENSKKGGYVQIDFLEKSPKEKSEKETYSDKILEILKNLNPKYHFGEVCVLVRSKKTGVEIAKNLSIAGYEIVSSDSLLLYQSKSVDFCLNFLRYLVQEIDKKSLAKALGFLHQHFAIPIDLADLLADLTKQSKAELQRSLATFGIDFKESKFNQLAIYQAITYLVRAFKLVKTSDAYIQFFLEEVLKFEQQQKGGLQQFLEFFEEKKADLSIVSSKNTKAIQILTIHKAKGLEFPIVIFPNNENIYSDKNATEWYHPENPADFNNFESILLEGGQKLEKTDRIGQALYAQRKIALELDNMNLLYVGLTRAVEQLYIITEPPSATTISITYGKIFEDYLKTNRLWQAGQRTYCFGNCKRLQQNENEKIDINQTLVLTSISTDWDSHNIKIVTNASKYWSEAQQDAADYGTLLHDILAEIKTADDVNIAVNQYQKTGKISQEVALNFKDLLSGLVNHPLLKSCFSNNNTVYNECEIVTNEKQIYRLDRLIINDNQAIIIDYKTGKPKESHQIQINQYAEAMASLNFKIAAKILVYLQEPLNILFVN